MITSQARSHFYAIGGGEPRRLSWVVLTRPAGEDWRYVGVSEDGTVWFERPDGVMTYKHRETA